MGHGCRTERIGLTAEVSVLETTGLNRLLIIFTNPAIVWWRECGLWLEFHVKDFVSGVADAVDL